MIIWCNMYDANADKDENNWAFIWRFFESDSAFPYERLWSLSTFTRFFIWALHSLRNDFRSFSPLLGVFIWTLHSLRNDFGAFSPLLGVSFELYIPLWTTLELVHLFVTLDSVTLDLHIQIDEEYIPLVFLDKNEGNIETKITIYF
jgi:hypothetical protein